MSDSSNVNYAPPSKGSGVQVPILFGIVIALIAAVVYMFLQVDQMRTQMAAMQESLLNEVSDLRETSSVTNQTQQRRLETMREELEAAQRQAAMAVGQAKSEATKHAEELARRLETEQRRQAEAQQQVKQELSQVAQATEANITSIGEVKSTVEKTVSELDKTIAALQSVTGDLGVQSGLIARNAEELAALKALGDRNYYEFDLRKTKRPVRVGDISVRLRDTNAGRGMFTVDVVADDKLVQKKNRGLNEPLQFYVLASKQPYELVVNKLEKDRIIGYLATPKVNDENRNKLEQAAN